MTAFLIICLVFCSLAALADLIVLVCIPSDNEGVGTLGLALLNLFPLIMSIIGLSLAL